MSSSCILSSWCVLIQAINCADYIDYNEKQSDKFQVKDLSVLKCDPNIPVPDVPMVGQSNHVHESGDEPPRKRKLPETNNDSYREQVISGTKVLVFAERSGPD